MSFFYPLILMERQLPIIELEKDGAEAVGASVEMSPLEKRKSMRKRLPDGSRTSLPTGDAQASFNGAKGNVVEHGLNTVCEEARCPNIHDCWGRGTATFMIAGEVCTRGCSFVQLVQSKLHLTWILMSPRVGRRRKKNGA